MMTSRNPTIGSRIPTARISFSELIMIAIAPVMRTAERGMLQHRLLWSARNVETLKKQIRNDNAAKPMASPAQIAALNSQIAQAQDDIASEHTRQAALNSRLRELA